MNGENKPAFYANVNLRLCKKMHNKNLAGKKEIPTNLENKPCIALLIIDNIRRKAYIKHIINKDAIK